MLFVAVWGMRRVGGGGQRKLSCTLQGHKDQLQPEGSYQDLQRRVVRVIESFRFNIGWVRFFVVCFLYKPIPTHEKNVCCEKKWPNCHF